MPNTFDPKVFANMQDKKPYTTYEKTILGKVFVTVLDPFSGNPVGMLLHGRRGEPDTIINMWSEVEDLFFKRSNRRELERGTIVKVVLPEQVEEPHTIEQYSDDELKSVINQRYASFQKVLSSIENEAVVYRMLNLAEEMEKSDRIMQAIKSKLAELQMHPAKVAG